MFSLISAGSGSAHYFAPWALSDIFRCERCLSEYVSHCIPAKGNVAFAWEGWAQLRFQMRREDCTVVRKHNFSNQDHSVSRHAQPYAHLAEVGKQFLLAGRFLVGRFLRAVKEPFWERRETFA